jgi:hypothetical protein
MRADTTEKCLVERHVVLWQYPAHDMNFRHGLPVVLFDDIEHIVHRVFPGRHIAALLDQAGIGTEFAVVDAQIRRFDMEIAVEIGAIAILALAHVVGQYPQVAQFAVVIEVNTFFRRDAFVGIYFPGDGQELRVGSSLFDQHGLKTKSKALGSQPLLKTVGIYKVPLKGFSKSMGARIIGFCTEI